MILQGQSTGVTTGIGHRLTAVRAFVLAHPCASVVLVAAVARVAFAILSFRFNHGYLIPDESEYMSLGRYVASGRSADSWVPFYGQDLYDSTRTYMVPLVQVLKAFGDSRLVGQLYTSALGTAAVAVGARVLRSVTTPGWTVLGGLVLAVLPSQVVFSSVVLREADVWLCLAIALAGSLLLASDDGRRMVGGAALLGAGLLGVGFLRQQTLVAAAWALAAGAVLVGRRRLVPRAGAAIALALLVPVVAGLGVGGWTLVERAVPNLGRTRTVMSLGAETGFTPTTLAPSTVVTTADGTPVAGSSGGGGGSGAVDAHEEPGALGIAGRRQAVPASDGNVYIADEGLSANLSSLPRGLVANVLRPFPWESGSSLSFLLARAESLIWYALYALAAIGAVVAARLPSLRRRLVFPALLTIAIVVVAAVSQGNLGTAYRHRQQVALPLLLFAVVGAEWSWAKWQSRRGAPAGADEHEAALSGT